jgi:uncharacterized membrane protein
MSHKTLKIVEWITCLVMAGVLAVTIIFGIWYLPLIAMFAAAVMFGILISRMKEVYADERTRAIDEKSGKATMTIATFCMFLSGSILLAINSDISSNIGQAAITIYAVTFVLNIISILTKLYYRTKLGGRE